MYGVDVLDGSTGTAAKKPPVTRPERAVGYCLFVSK